MIRFYGLSIDDIDNLSMGEFMELLEAMSLIKNQEFLDRANSSMWPYIDKSKRSQLYNKIKNNSVLPESVERTSTQDLARRLGLIK